MKIEPVIHHHFEFSSAILEQTGYCKEISFRSIPFFKLYSMKSLELIRNALESLEIIMPHRLQSVMRELRPVYLEDADYRQDLIPMKYCSLNRQKFFVRVYKLRHKDFIKVEISIHSKTLGDRKYYNLEKGVRTACSVFDYLEQTILALSPILHLDEYFYISDFRTKVRAYQNHLNIIQNCSSKKIREALIIKLKKYLREFQKNAKQEAFIRLQSLKSEQSLCSNRPPPL